MHVIVVFFQTDNKYQIEICQKLLNREEINPVLTFFCKTARVKGDYSRSCNIMRPDCENKFWTRLGNVSVYVLSIVIRIVMQTVIEICRVYSAVYSPSRRLA